MLTSAHLSTDAGSLTSACVRSVASISFQCFKFGFSLSHLHHASYSESQEAALSDTLGRMRPMLWSSQPQNFGMKFMQLESDDSISFPRDRFFHWASHTRFFRLDCRPYWGFSLACKAPGRVQAFMGREEKSPKGLTQRDTKYSNTVIQ